MLRGSQHPFNSHKAQAMEKHALFYMLPWHMCSHTMESAAWPWSLLFLILLLVLLTILLVLLLILIAPNAGGSQISNRRGTTKVLRIY